MTSEGSTKTYIVSDDSKYYTRLDVSDTITCSVGTESMGAIPFLSILRDTKAIQRLKCGLDQVKNPSGKQVHILLNRSSDIADAISYGFTRHGTTPTFITTANRLIHELTLPRTRKTTGPSKRNDAADGEKRKQTKTKTKRKQTKTKTKRKRRR